MWFPRFIRIDIYVGFRLIFSRSKVSDFYLAYLNTFQKHSGAFPKESNDIARKMLAFVIKSPHIYQFENIMALDAVQAVKDDALYQLLTIFTTGDLAAYKAFATKHASALQAAGITSDDGIRKIRLLMLANLAANNLVGSVSYEQVSKTLEIAEDVVEPWIIDGNVWYCLSDVDLKVFVLA